MHQHHQVEAAVLERQGMHVTLAHFHVGQAPQPFAGRGDHACAGVDADVALGVGGDEFGQYAVAGRDIQYVAGLQQRQRGPGQCLPGASRRVVAFHVAGHAVGPVLVGGAVGQHRGHPFGILAQQRVIASVAQGVPQCALRRVQLGLVEAVVGRHARAAVADQAGFLQACQVRGHARLRQAGDRRQLGHGQLFLLQQRQQAHAGRISEHLQASRPVFKIHKYLPIAI
ncbi:hypothetical protein G6F57_013747 [Rhizopus arrhizus]|nr:hypothetical protein G6F22_012135 [Rhizopus arrhizus]KAG1463502.1 hypothetical protein G6F57_013747 [Rhizopus arrhizus]